jgi:copper transport protein
MRRAAAALGVVALVAVALPAAASAHASLRHTTPATQSRVDTAPGRIVLRFDQAVGVIPHTLEVVAADGRKLSGPPAYGADHRVVWAPVRGFVRGGYTVRWRVLSSDGHVGSGLFTFGYRIAAPPPTEAYGASGPTWSDDAARWGLFVSLALLLGSLGVRLLVLPEELPPALSRRLYLFSGLGAFAAIDVGIAAFVLRAEDALQLPFVDLMYGDLSPFATKTRFGVAFVAMTLGFALVATFVFLSWLLDAPRLLWPAFAIGLGFASGLSLSGHSAVEPNSSWFSQLADFLHLAAASLWAGGLFTLALAVWPLAPELRKTAFLGFSRLATVLVGVLVLAGTYLTILRLPAVHDLWSAGYGHVLLVKLAVVAVALSWGAAHHFVVRPRLERGDSPGGLRRSLLGELSVALGVLLAAAVLVNSAPPPRADSGSAQLRAVSR